MFKNPKLYYKNPKDVLNEYIRPWKLLTFFFGIFLLVLGAINYTYSDWDIGVSILMGTLTYLLGPISLSWLLYSFNEKKPFYTVLFLITEIFVVDISYTIWHTVHQNITLRYNNFLVSSCLYIFCSMVWIYRGSLKDIYQEIKMLFTNT